MAYVVYMHTCTLSCVPSVSHTCTWSVCVVGKPRHTQTLETMHLNAQEDVCSCSKTAGTTQRSLSKCQSSGKVSGLPPGISQHGASLLKQMEIRGIQITTSGPFLAHRISQVL